MKAAEAYWSLTIALIGAMIASYFLGFAFIPFITVERPSGPITYHITVLHIFVVFGALHLPLRQSLLLGLVMGLLSVARAYDLRGTASLLEWCHYLLPRIGVPAATYYTFQRLRAWNNRYLAYGLAALAGTAANTVGYSAFVFGKIFVGVDYEVQKLGLTYLDWSRIALRHLTVEAAAAIGLMLFLKLHVSRSHSSATGRGEAPAPISQIAFAVGFSFPGGEREFVQQVVRELEQQLPNEQLFYDMDYSAQLAVPNLDVVLVNLYRFQCELLAVFVCREYREREWCGLEWRAVRDVIKSMQDKKVMLLRRDDGELPGLLSIDGYLDIRNHDPVMVASAIKVRLASARKGLVV